MKQLKMNISIVYTALALIVGFCFPIMSSSNVTLSKTLGSPLVATLTVFILGSLLLSIIIISTKTSIPSITQFKQINWKVWAGAAIVILNLITFTVVPTKIGVANMITLFVSGQLIASVVAEHFGLLNFPVHLINWHRIAGIICLIAGVILIKKF